MAFDRISIDPAKMGGAPCIRETRLTVKTVLARVAADGNFTDVLDDYPYLETEDITQALQFAAALTDFREVSLDGSSIRPGRSRARRAIGG